MPSNPKETQPHPYGVDVETIRRLINSNSYNLVDSNHKLLENELQNLLSIQMSDIVKCKNFCGKIFSFLQTPRFRFLCFI